MYIIWGSEAFWTGAQVQATQGKCAQLREKRRTLTDTYACITQSVKYNNLYACHARKLFFIDIFFHHLHHFLIFRYFVLHYTRFYGTVFESSGLGMCIFKWDALYIVSSGSEVRRNSPRVFGKNTKNESLWRNIWKSIISIPNSPKPVWVSILKEVLNQRFLFFQKNW